MKVITIEETRLNELQLPRARTSYRNYVGQAGVLLDGPQAYLVQMPDWESIVPPHFHDIDQFQIALDGDGKFGKKSWQPGDFFYADAYTSYGPIIAGKEGLSWFTLRVASASGQYEMPGSKHLRPAIPGRAAAGSFDLRQPVPAEGSNSVRLPITSRSDGLQVIGLRMAPHAKEPGVVSDGGGQYYVIYSGSLVDRERFLTKYSLIFVDAGEPPPLLCAGPEGAVIVLLQFPRPSDRAGSDPSKLSQRDRTVEYVVAR